MHFLRYAWDVPQVKSIGGDTQIAKVQRSIPKDYQYDGWTTWSTPTLEYTISVRAYILLRSAAGFVRAHRLFRIKIEFKHKIKYNKT